MDKPAVIRAEFTDYRPVKTRKVLQLVFEVPAEDQTAVFAALGYPIMGSSLWVAIAKLAQGAQAPRSPVTAEQSTAPQGATENGPAAKHEFCQDAGRMLGKPEFRSWLCHTYQEQWNRNEGHKPSGEVADATLKDILGIDSKCDLDRYEMKGARWLRLKTDFDTRSYQR